MNDFYPFGGSHDQESMIGVANKYKYQGKELIAELGLGLYDFHARQYDPLLGRFMSIDPAGQFASGYVGMGNSPVVMVDPNGEFAWFVPVIFGVANLAGEAIRGNVNSFEDGLLAFGIGAAQGTVAAITGGASFAAQGGGWLAVSQAVSSQLPGVTIPLGEGGSSLTLSPSLIFGSHNFSAGINGSLNIQAGNVGLSYGFGASYGKGLGPSGNRFQGGLGVAASYNSDSFGASFGVNNYFSGATSQETGVTRLRFGQVNIGFENDFPFGDQGDRYRTAALEVGYKDFAVGFSLFTGDPVNPTTELREIDDKRGGKAGLYTYEGANRYRAGLLYASYRGSRLGVDSEGVRAFIQNNFHDAIGSAHFERMNTKSRLYYEYIRGGRFGLY